MAPKKKTVLIVKEIKPESPKKGIFVSRPPRDKHEVDGLSPSSKGNVSPQRPLRTKDGVVLSRSILGDPALFDKLESVNASRIASRSERSENVEMNFANFSPRGTSASRVVTVGSKRSLSAAQTMALVNPSSNPDLYLSTMKHLQEKSLKIHAHEVMKEATMTEYLPVNERFSLNKEGKVLTRWQERQQSWQRIQNALAKTTKRDRNSTMMATSDEFRAKMEEYDILQAAIPPHEKFGESSWEMQLRGGGERGVAVGHRLSGLFCPIKNTAKIPLMVRKAKPIDHTRKNMSYLDETPAMTILRKRLKKYVAEIRPHSISVLDAEGLTLKTVNLFQWAQESSKAVFQQRKTEEDAAAAAVAASLTSKLTLGEQTSAKKEITGPMLEVSTSREIVFTATGDEIVHQTFVFKNTGSTVLAYRWRIKPKHVIDQSITGQVVVPPSDVSVLLSDNTNKCREHLLSSQRSAFFCVNHTGQALPGVTVQSVFTFTNRTGGGGNVSEEWMLETTPRCVMFLPTWQRPSNASGSPAVPASPVNAVPMTSPLYITLHGYTSVVDKNSYKRAQTMDQLERLGVRSFIEEIITRCVLRVRSPVTVEQIKQRKVDYFLQKNSLLLASISVVFREALQVFVNFERCQVLTELYLRARSFCKAVRLRLAALQGEDARRRVISDLADESRLETERLRAVRDAIFPAKIVEIFDEVDEGMVGSPWDMDVQSLLIALEDAETNARVIAELEAAAKLMEAREEKLRLIAKLKAEDSDYEEDEEEEEEEEDDEEKPLSKEPDHPVLRHAKALLSELRGKLLLLTLEPLPDATEPARTALTMALHHVDEAVDDARAEFDILPNDILPQLHNAFHDHEGVEVWRKIVTGEGIEDVDSKGTKKAMKSFLSTKVKKSTQMSSKQLLNVGGGVVPAVQVVQYRRSLYNHIQHKLLDACCDAMFDPVYSELERASVIAFESSVYKDLHTAAMLRPQDVSISTLNNGQGAVGFLTFDGDAFVGKGFVSAFEETQRRRSLAISSIEFVADCGASAVVLLYENSCPIGSEDEDWSLLGCSAQIQSMLDSNVDVLAAMYAKLSAKKKKAAPVSPTPRSYRVVPCRTIADLKLAIEMHAETMSSRPTSGDDASASPIPVFVLETISPCTTLVPSEPPLPPEDEDEWDAPLPLGRDVAAAKREAAWKALAPRRMPVTASVLGVTKEVLCYTDVAAALGDVLRIAEDSSTGAVWVDGHMGSLFPRDDTGILPRLCPSSGRFLSRGLKQDVQWAFCVTLLRDRIAEELRALAVSDESADGSAIAHTPPIATEFGKLFPLSISLATPRFMVVLGGQIRADKFAIISKMLDQVHTIYLVGELCLPFLCLSRTITLSRYVENMAQYAEVCQQLVRKARMRGVRLLLPDDVVEGDEKPMESDRQRCYENIDRDSRDDGVEYPGEARTTLLYTPPVVVVEAPPVAESKRKKSIVHDSHAHKKDAHGHKKDAQPPPPPPLVAVEDHYIVSGFVLDIGPKSTRRLQEEVQTSDAVMCWGPSGFCELSAFQASMRAVVEVASKIKGKSNSVSEIVGVEMTKKPVHTFVVGETTVEWWTRIADADGEKNGDLVRHGLVSYTSRDSVLISAVLGSCPSPALRNVVRREPIEGEWMFDPPPPIIDEDDVEEDEDEEDEEDAEDDD